jgi:hypothetical protein
VIEQLLSSVILPAAAQLIQVSPRSPAASAPFVLTAGSVDMERVFVTRLPKTSAIAFMLAHAPRGMDGLGTGEVGDPGHLVAEDLYYVPAAMPPGITGAELVIIVMPGPGPTTLIGTYSYSSWFPARSASRPRQPSRYWTSRPSSSLSTSSARSMSSVSWVATSAVIPSDRTTVRSSRMICRPVSKSSWPVGSSAISS